MAEEEKFKLVGANGGKSKLSFWGFSQLASKAQAPPNYLRTLPSQIAVTCLNHGLKQFVGTDTPIELMFHHTENEDQQLAYSGATWALIPEHRGHRFRNHRGQ